jgi:1,4-dihydroxy-2-naphthoate polyprenyltransferase
MNSTDCQFILTHGRRVSSQTKSARLAVARVPALTSADNGCASSPPGTQRHVDLALGDSTLPARATRVGTRLGRSLPVAVSPVLVGTALALLRQGSVDGPAACAALGASLLMQLITNLQNDVGYTVRGAERGGTRTGLPRATAQGWLTVRQVRAVLVAACVVAGSLGLALVWYRGWPVLVLGTASLWAAVAYMGGPKPIAYTPLGELTVFLFFGGVAVIGTEWLLTGSVGAVTALAAAAVGSLGAAALAVNNHRDVTHDRQVGRRTFAVTFGEHASRRLFSALLFGPFLLLPAMAMLAGTPALLLPGLLGPSALRLRRAFEDCAPGTAYNAVLFRTFQMNLAFATLLSAGALSARYLG